MLCKCYPVFGVYVQDNRAVWVDFVAPVGSEWAAGLAQILKNNYGIVGLTVSLLCGSLYLSLPFLHSVYSLILCPS